MRYLALFMLGFLLGACLLNLLLAQQQEQLYLDKTELLQQLNSAELEIARLKENLAEKTDRVVASIEPIIKFKHQVLTGLEARAASQLISGQVQEFLQPLMGQKISTINAALIPNMVAGRRVKTNGTELRLEVELVLISDRLVIYLVAEKESANQQP